MNEFIPEVILQELRKLLNGGHILIRDISHYSTLVFEQGGITMTFYFFHGFKNDAEFDTVMAIILHLDRMPSTTFNIIVVTIDGKELVYNSDKAYTNTPSYARKLWDNLVERKWQPKSIKKEFDLQWERHGKTTHGINLNNAAQVTNYLGKYKNSYDKQSPTPPDNYALNA